MTEPGGPLSLLSAASVGNAASFSVPFLQQRLADSEAKREETLSQMRALRKESTMQLGVLREQLQQQQQKGRTNEWRDDNEALHALKVEVEAARLQAARVSADAEHFHTALGEERKKVDALETALRAERGALADGARRGEEALEKCKAFHAKELGALQARHDQEVSLLQGDEQKHLGQVERLHAEVSNAKHALKGVSAELEAAMSTQARDAVLWRTREGQLQAAVERERESRALASVELQRTQDELCQALSGQEGYKMELSDVTLKFDQTEKGLLAALEASKGEVDAGKAVQMTRTVCRMGRGMMAQGFEGWARATWCPSLEQAVKVFQRASFTAQRFKIAVAWRTWVGCYYQDLMEEEIAKHTTVCDDYSVFVLSFL
jgi:hypothetical protein